ncbi:MAG: alpha/beta hydrolase [Alphaproteobacteria bacterium]|nr:alpha/beta hydrolase [Alphaproteobacteria bacterium]
MRIAGPYPPPPGGQVLRLASPPEATIRHAHWRPPGGSAIGSVLVLPGFGEFIEKYHETVDDLLKRGFDVHVIDWYGQGLSTRGLANRDKVHVDDFRRYLVDLHRLVETMPPLRDRLRFRMVLGHSLGAHLALRLLNEHPNAFNAAVLTSPMIDIDYRIMPRWLARPLAAAMCAAGLSRRYVLGAGDYAAARARFEGNRRTADRRRFHEQHAWIAQCRELAVGGPTFGWVRAAQRSIALTEHPGFARAIRTPTLIVASGRDRIVRPRATERLARAMPDATLIEIADALHEILHEREPVRALFWQQFDRFLGIDGAVPRQDRGAAD